MNISSTVLLTLLLLTTPVTVGSNYQYSRLIQTDQVEGYKSIVIDKDIYVHSNQLNDLRVVSDRGEEVPYYLSSIQDAATEKEKDGYLLSEEAHYNPTQDGNDSIIEFEVNHLNPFRIELNVDEKFARSYGLFGLDNKSIQYLKDGDLNTLNRNLTVPVIIDFPLTYNPPLDKIKLIIHNRAEKPIYIKAITVQYHLYKLVFKDMGKDNYRLTYGNDTLRLPIYDTSEFKASIKNDFVSSASLGEEVQSPTKTQLSKTPLINPTLIKIATSIFILLFILGIGLRLRKRSHN